MHFSIIELWLWAPMEVRHLNTAERGKEKCGKCDRSCEETASASSNTALHSMLARDWLGSWQARRERDGWSAWRKGGEGLGSGGRHAQERKWKEGGGDKRGGNIGCLHWGKVARRVLWKHLLSIQRGACQMSQQHMLFPSSVPPLLCLYPLPSILPRFWQVGFVSHCSSPVARRHILILTHTQPFSSVPTRRRLQNTSTKTHTSSSS